MQRLNISDNRRFLVYEDGTPFFYLGDTAWELFHRCNRAEATLYLQDRAAKRFTVIQAVVLAESDGLNVPNTEGDLPLLESDPTRPNEAYFQHVDFIVETANRLGLQIGMLPTWGDKWNPKWAKRPPVFTPENARIYGEFIGKRYRNADLIWILGGDRDVENKTHRAILQAMAEGIRAGDGGTHLITLHPMGGQCSAQYFPDAPWLDFHLWQSGHNRNGKNYEMIETTYQHTPTKPVLDAEPGYEDHSASFDLNNGYLDDYDTRKSLYWGLFAGGCGHTYGCHPIWQMWMPERAPYTFCRRTWMEALSLPGSGQMQYGRALLESRPFLSRIPDQSLLVSDPGTGTHHVQATRDSEGGYALVYLANVREVELDLRSLSGETLVAWWYNPRNGTAQRIGEVTRAASVKFNPPAVGPDWVLVLDDASRRYPAPGTAVYRETATSA